jgi:hypothetical protein
MKPRQRTLRPPAVLIFAAAIFLSEAASAFAAETAYLMYLRGSEGPPAIPIRVLWDEIDDASARITIDFGTKYEAFLGKLGLARALKHDAKLEQARFVVRNPEFVRFVKIVSTSIVQELLPKAAVGVAAKPVEAMVHDAALSITAAPDKTRLEVITWLHVTYPEPQKSGPPKNKNLVKGDLAFVGKPEPPPSR